MPKILNMSTHACRKARKTNSNHACRYFAVHQTDSANACLWSMSPAAACMQKELLSPSSSSSVIQEANVTIAYSQLLSKNQIFVFKKSNSTKDNSPYSHDRVRSMMDTPTNDGYPHKYMQLQDVSVKENAHNYDHPQYLESSKAVQRIISKEQPAWFQLLQLLLKQLVHAMQTQNKRIPCASEYVLIIYF